MTKLRYHFEIEADDRQVKVKLVSVDGDSEPTILSPTQARMHIAAQCLVEVDGIIEADGCSCQSCKDLQHAALSALEAVTSVFTADAPPPGSRH